MRAHNVSQIEVHDNELVLLVDGETHRFPLASISPRLARAAPAEQEHFEVSPSGYGIHWPLLDEDLSIDGLLGVRHQPHRGAKGRRETLGAGD